MFLRMRGLSSIRFVRMEIHIALFPLMRSGFFSLAHNGYITGWALLLRRHGHRLGLIGRLVLLDLGDLEPVAPLRDATLDDVAEAIGEQRCAD
jgi:hypothetical protein